MGEQSEKKNKRINCERWSEICAEDSGGFIVFALTIEALNAIWFGPEKGFVLACSAITVIQYDFEIAEEENHLPSL